MGTTKNYRRYQRGKNPLYDDRYALFMQRSVILNAGQRSQSMTYCFEFKTKESVLRRISEIEGDLEIITNNDNVVKPDNLGSKLKDLELKIRDYKKEQTKMGWDFKDVTPPGDMTEILYDLQARVDVKEMELDRLKEKLTKFEDTTEKERQGKMLKRGPEFRRWGDPPREVDGQQVDFVDGIMIISDPASPYRGMSLADFAALAQWWHKNKPRIYKENIVMPVKKEDLPPWPDGVKNHLKEVEKEKE